MISTVNTEPALSYFSDSNQHKSQMLYV